MIFISKRNIGNGHSSNKEACLSIIGLFLAVGFIGGLAGLIYGLVKGSSSGTIAGAIVLGISIVLTIIFVFTVVLCLKNNNINSNTNQQQQQHHQRKQNRQTKHDYSLREIKTISTVQKYEQNNDLNKQMFSSSISRKLAEKKNYGFTKHTIQPSSKSFIFTYLNDSHSSINSNNSRQNNYNRH
ncbi:unnamed protein product [Rotaria sp. Silwood1]|nr:unnamed protein product [Rotaria sp. Silwood1]CAF0959179.1 unnamed protein product [Rotaria sp. Silwood1]CAF3346939.1 unnamed protein product [Rotaria sp. Silwood1]CAF3370613.1 unnamed protein product [Rotaria sp. Silwood1]CAF3370950.1 unnamed protein product [Rotaria sp. Silwood1]